MDPDNTRRHPPANGSEEGSSRARSLAPLASGVVAAVIIALVAVALVVGSRGDGAQPTSAPLTAEPSAPAPAEPGPGETSRASGTAGNGQELSGVPVYWVGQSKTRFWLYREFRDVPDVGGLVASAVAAMTRDKPLDPDYSNPWEPATSVKVTQHGGDIAVDLSADAFSSHQVGSEVAALAIQQLVYTATGAASVAGTPASSVTITVDGGPYDAWGVVRVGEPVSRSPVTEVQAPTWVLSPTQGEVVPAGEVSFSGYGTAFEGTFLWEVRNGSGAVVANGSTHGGSMGTYGAFSFAADLPPGQYTVEVYQPDESGGESPEGPRMYPDTKDFTVR
ncbi:MAG: Gmad2 immunoglobulin-like domain-containing protein [Actinomycetes bacterium]